MSDVANKWMVAYTAEPQRAFTTYRYGPNVGEPVLFDTKAKAERNARDVVELGFCQDGDVKVVQV